MRKALLVLFFGLLPLWTVLFLLAAGKYTGLIPRISVDAASWLLVAAVLCSVVTLALSLLALGRSPEKAASPRLPDDN